MRKKTLTKNTYGLFTVDGRLEGKQSIELSVVATLKDVEKVVELLNKNTELNDAIHWSCERILR